MFASLSLTGLSCCTAETLTTGAATMTTRASAEHHLRSKARAGKVDPNEAAEKLYGKRVEDWDDLELAHGRPRNNSGNFTGPVPAWITPLVEEEVKRRFGKVLRTKLGVVSLSSVAVLEKLMLDDGTSEDDRGRIWHRVAPGVRADIAKYLLDQIVGRATQPVDVNANVKLVSLLAQVVQQDGEGEPAVGFAERIDFQDAEEADPSEEEDAG